jgi:RNA polymerase sigma factor (sigma-70 family)
MVARSNDRLREERDHEGGPPPGGVRRSGTRPRRGTTLPERLDALEAISPCRSFEEVWKRYEPAVRDRLRRGTLPEDVREDLLAEVFCTMGKIIREEQAIPSVPGRTLGTITTHAICNYARTKKRRPAFVSDEALETVAAPSSRSSPQVALQQARRERFVHLILALMDDRDAQLIELVHFFEIPEDELAREMGVPAGTLRYRVSVARNKFRKLAKRYQAEVGEEL